MWECDSHINDVFFPPLHQTEYLQCSGTEENAELEAALKPHLKKQCPVFSPSAELGEATKRLLPSFTKTRGFTLIKKLLPYAFSERYLTSMVQDTCFTLHT